MINEIEIEVFNNSTKKVTEEEVLLNLKLKINNELYEEKIISYDVFKYIRKKLMKKIEIIHKNTC